MARDSATPTPPATSPAVHGWLEWGARPTVHDADPYARPYAPTQWMGRAIHGREILTCSYCGSAHPQVLLEALGAVAPMRPPWMQPAPDESWSRWLGLDPADMTYGWPHKFYLQGPGLAGLKFYTLHALDVGYGAVAGAAIRELLARHGRVEVAREGDMIRWRMLGWEGV